MNYSRAMPTYLHAHLTILPMEMVIGLGITRPAERLAIDIASWREDWCRLYVNQFTNRTLYTFTTVTGVFDE
jgi:hypothetical protein